LIVTICLLIALSVFIYTVANEDAKSRLFTNQLCVFLVMRKRKGPASDQEMAFSENGKKGSVPPKKHIKLSYSSTSSANNSDSEDTSAMLTQNKAHSESEYRNTSK